MDKQDNCAQPAEKKPEVKSYTDRSWAWVVLSATVLNSVIATGQVGSVNIYYVIFLEEFKASSSFTAWIPSAQNTAMCISGPLTSALLKRVGPRRTIFIGALLMSLCYIMAYFANSIPYLIVNYAFLGVSHNLIDGGSLAALTVYFHKKLSLATGIMYAGAGIGLMIMGLEVEWAVEIFGWRGAMLIQSGLACQICACAALVYAVPSSSKKSTDVGGAEVLPELEECPKEGATVATSGQSEPPKLSLKVLGFDALFWLSVLEFIAIQGNFSAIATILKGWVVATGHESLFKTVVSMIGIGNMFGRLMTGPISNRISPPIYLLVVCTLYSASNFLLMIADGLWFVGGLSFAFGFFQGQFLVCWILKIAWAFGRRDFAIVRGYVFFFGICASLSFPPLIGYTVDITEKYDLSLIISSSASLSCAIFSILSWIIHRKRIAQKSTESVTSDQPPPSEDTPNSDENSSKITIETTDTCIPG